MCFVVLLTGAAAFAGIGTPLVREEHIVTVEEVEERWRLEWVSAPSPVCSPEEPEWSTCPCEGFAFGESGDLVLVRNRPGQEEERLPLSRLFDGDLDLPGVPDTLGQAILRRWDTYEKDIDESGAVDFASRVRARPIATVMRFGDYDHDGRATEFLLQVGTLPCGMKMSVAVGISRSTPNLHVFSTVEHPEKRLILTASQWQALLEAKSPIKVGDWLCGDHGSDTETELELGADADGIHAKKREYECKDDGGRGQFIGEEVL